jgi:hypothetical protein
VKFGTVDGESLAGGAQLQVVARVENQVVGIVDGAVAAAVDGVHLGNLERARARKRNLPRVDVGDGAIAPQMDGNLVTAGLLLESLASLALHHLEAADGMERMTMIGQAVIRPITSLPANLISTTGLVAMKLASPNPSLLPPTPLAGKMMDGMPTSTTRLTLKVFAKSVTQ